MARVEAGNWAWQEALEWLRAHPSYGATAAVAGGGRNCGPSSAPVAAWSAAGPFLHTAGSALGSSGGAAESASPPSLFGVLPALPLNAKPSNRGFAKSWARGHIVPITQAGRLASRRRRRHLVSPPRPPLSYNAGYTQSRAIASACRHRQHGRSASGRARCGLGPLRRVSAWRGRRLFHWSPRSRTTWGMHAEPTASARRSCACGGAL